MLARRSPPRCSRIRLVLPEETGIGATPQSRANAPPTVESLDVLARGDEQLGRVLRADAQTLQ